MLKRPGIACAGTGKLELAFERGTGGSEHPRWLRRQLSSAGLGLRLWVRSGIRSGSKVLLLCANSGHCAQQSAMTARGRDRSVGFWNNFAIARRPAKPDVSGNRVYRITLHFGAALALSARLRVLDRSDCQNKVRDVCFRKAMLAGSPHNKVVVPIVGKQRRVDM